VVAASLLLASCAGTRELAPFETASSAAAALHWQRGGAALNGEAAVARSTQGAVLLRFYKAAPAPLLQLRLEPDAYLTASGPLAGRGWAGPPGSAPISLMAWASFLKIYQQAAKLPDGERELHTAAERVAYVKTGGKLRSLSVASRDTGEVISAFFQP